jgi:branched-subunit amino acid permease
VCVPACIYRCMCSHMRKATGMYVRACACMHTCAGLCACVSTIMHMCVHAMQYVYESAHACVCMQYKLWHYMIE